MRYVVAIVLLVAACTPDTSQHAHPARYKAPPPAPVLAPQDRDFLERAMQGSNAEVNCGGLARTHTQHGDIRAFGERMVADHGAMNQQLLAIATRYGIAPPKDSLGDQQASYDRLVDLRDARFDEQFVQVMLEDHQMALELFRSESSGGLDPMLRQFAATHVPVIEAHLAHVQAMAGPKPPPVP